MIQISLLPTSKVEKLWANTLSRWRKGENFTSSLIPPCRHLFEKEHAWDMSMLNHHGICTVLSEWSRQVFELTDNARTRNLDKFIATRSHFGVSRFHNELCKEMREIAVKIKKKTRSDIERRKIQWDIFLCSDRRLNVGSKFWFQTPCLKLHCLRHGNGE
jgi:hypothetical protein